MNVCITFRTVIFTRVRIYQCIGLPAYLCLHARSKFFSMWRTNYFFSGTHCLQKICTRRTAVIMPMDARRIFPGVGIEGSEGRNSPAGFRGRAPVGVWLRRWRHCLKITHKYFIYWCFRQYLLQKKHFATFPEGVPLPKPAGAHGSEYTPVYCGLTSS